VRVSIPRYETHIFKTQYQIKTMKYKIQTEGAFGWGDLKHSHDQGLTYQTDLYDTKEDARKELDSIFSEFGEDEDSYRIVSEDVLEDFNIYVE